MGSLRAIPEDVLLFEILKMEISDVIRLSSSCRRLRDLWKQTPHLIVNSRSLQQICQWSSRRGSHQEIHKLLQSLIDVLLTNRVQNSIVLQSLQLDFADVRIIGALAVEDDKISAWMEMAAHMEVKILRFCWSIASAGERKVVHDFYLCRRLRVLDLQGCDLTSLNFENERVLFPCLMECSFARNRVTTTILQKLLEHSPKLQTLILECPFTLSHLVVRSSRTLRKLYWKASLSVSSEKIRLEIVDCPSLDSLSLDFRSSEDFDPQIEVEADNCISLEVNSSHLKKFTHLQSVKNLSVRPSLFCSFDFEKEIAGFSNIERLELFRLNIRSMKSVLWMPTERLKWLSIPLGGFGEVEVSAIHMILQQAPFLQTLVLALPRNGKQFFWRKAEDFSEETFRSRILKVKPDLRIECQEQRSDS